MSLVPANHLVEQGLEKPSLVGDGVLADVNADLLQRLLDDGRHLLPINCRKAKKTVGQSIRSTKLLFTAVQEAST